MQRRTRAIGAMLGAAVAVALGALVQRSATGGSDLAKPPPVAAGEEAGAMCRVGEAGAAQVGLRRAMDEDRAREAANAAPVEEGELLNTRGFNYASGAARLDVGAIEFEAHGQR